MKVTLRAVKGHGITERLKKVIFEAESVDDQRELIKLVSSIKEETLPAVEMEIMKWANQQG